MDIKKIKSLVAQKESEALEFKKTTGQLHAGFETLCAFLNGEGGTILFGVGDDGRISGQDISDSTRQAIANEIHKLEPPAQLEINYILIEKNKYVISIQTESGTHAPYSYDGRPFQRHQSVTKKMHQQRYDELIAHRFQHNFSWEELIAKDYTVRDLDRNLILGIVRKAVEIRRMPEEAMRQSVSKILASLKLTVDGYLKTAAVALFAKNTFPTYPQCQLKMARFKGVDRHEFLDSDLVYGNTFDLLEKGMLFVRKHLPLAGKIEPGKLERVETLLIPFDAVREALINSLCHSDFSHRSGSIGLAIYDDRMEIFNNGGLRNGVTLEKIKKGFSSPRNSLIADIFYRANLIEKWGRGIPGIIGSCKVAHDPEPEFYIDNAEFKIIFKFPKNLQFSQPSQSYIEGDTERKLTNRQKEIIRILSLTKETKTRQIIELLKESVTERTLQRELATLKKLKIAEKHGHAKTAVWFLVSSTSSQ